MLRTRLRGLLTALGLVLATAVLSGCVAYPAGPTYAYAPAYGYGYYAAPSVSLGIGFGCCWGGYYGGGWGGWHGHGWR
ncbi:MAG: hypothetical protein ACREFP_16550 [Acetobacteraceae bacterium]